MTINNYIKIQLEIMKEQIQNWRTVENWLKLNEFSQIIIVILLMIIIFKLS